MRFYDLLKINEWRYERKFFISNAHKSEVETAVKLHPAIFRTIFYERRVNNLYFDTAAMDFYNDNVIGTGQRLKVRIRWYGDMFGRIDEAILEIKCKNGLLGGKVRFPLQSFELQKNTKASVFESLFKNLPEDAKLFKDCLSSLNCLLLNSYTRSYFLSADGKFRATIDSNLQYYRFLYTHNNFLDNYLDKLNIVLELKYNEIDDLLADQVSSNFPFIITKSSKYVKGIDYLHV